MRIVHISYLHPAVVSGGQQQIAFELFQASLREGHDAFFVAALEPAHHDTYGKPGAVIVPVPGENRQFFYFTQFYDHHHLSVQDSRTVQFFRELIERLKPDVIHFHHYHRVGVESIVAARRGAPGAVIGLTFHEMMAICHADGQMLKNPSRELCYASAPIACNKCFPELRPEFFALRASRLKALFGECDVFVFPSEFVAERYVEWGLPAEKCIVIENGQADLGIDFDRKSHSPMVNRFGFFGQFLDNKGIDTILEALLILARGNRIPVEGVVVEINGSNKHYASKAYLEKIAKYTDALKNIPSHRICVRDRGSYDRKQLEDRMQSVDWVLVPSTWWEIFGLVVSEAWMFGRPVIVSAIAALEERVRNGVNGFTFPARNAQALADLMVSLVGDEQRWLSVNGSIASPWSDADMFDGYLEIWQECKGKRGALTSQSVMLQTRLDSIFAGAEAPIAPAIATDEPLVKLPKPLIKKRSARKPTRRRGAGDLALGSAKH
jgi:glycosyltransferase involved in cell wall biosynthesis